MTHAAAAQLFLHLHRPGSQLEDGAAHSVYVCVHGGEGLLFSVNAINITSHKHIESPVSRMVLGSVM